jgi:hypothetical protein
LDNNKTAITDKEKSEMLASHLENRFQHPKAISTIDMEVRNTIDLEYTTVKDQLKFTTPKDHKKLTPQKITW